MRMYRFKIYTVKTKVTIIRVGSTQCVNYDLFKSLWQIDLKGTTLLYLSKHK